MRTTCLKAIFDLLLFDPRLASLRPKNLQGIDEDEDGAEAGAGEKPMTVAEALVPALEDDDSEIATAAVEGYAKLLLTGRLGERTGTDTEASTVLSMMLQQFFHPEMDPNNNSDATRLNCCLKTFFPAYASGWHNSKDSVRAAGIANRNTLVRAAASAVSLLMDAPASSPQAEIPLDRLVAYLLDLLDAGAGQAKKGGKAGDGEEMSSHAMLGRILAVESICCGETEVAQLRVFCKALAKLAVPETDKWGIRAVKHLCGVLMEDGGPGDKQAATAIKKLTTYLHKMDSQDLSAVGNNGAKSSAAKGKKAKKVTKAAEAAKAAKAAAAAAAEEEEEEVEEDACNVCKSPEDGESMLLCGDGEGKGCDRGFHIHCLSPPLAAIPDGDWFCAKCSGKKTKKAQSCAWPFEDDQWGF